MTIAEKIRVVKIPEARFRSRVNRILEALVVAGLAISLSLASYLIWENYKEWYQRRLVARILPTTHWVQKSIPVYLVNYRELIRINLNGLGTQKVLSTSEPIRDGIFSPDGKNLLVAAGQELILVDLKSLKSSVIDSLELPKDSQDLKGAFATISWDREGKKILYKITRWSKVASMEQWAIYDLQKKEKKSLEALQSGIYEILWDWEGKNLYYVRFQKRKEGQRIVKIYRIALSDLKPQLAATLKDEALSLSAVDLKKEAFQLYKPVQGLSFKKKNSLSLSALSEKGNRAGLDTSNYLYYQDKKGKRKRVLELPRASKWEFMALDYLDWVPASDLLLLAHRTQGILLYDLSSRKVGRLIDMHVDAVGWPPFHH